MYRAVNHHLDEAKKLNLTLDKSSAFLKKNSKQLK